MAVTIFLLMGCQIVLYLFYSFFCSTPSAKNDADCGGLISLTSNTFPDSIFFFNVKKVNTKTIRKISLRLTNQNDMLFWCLYL